MAERLTFEQQMAVENRGGRLLVSAAAGSGKTKVLVDRLLSYLLDRENPANLDDFLIITYTKAAAAELRGKIAAKLSERIAQQPENRHLQQQLQRLYLTKISTVHAFCTDLLREFAYRLDIPGDFRVADENECMEMYMQVLEHLLDSAYETISQNPDFRCFVDTQGLGRDDRQVPEILLKVYTSAQCHLNPGKWLEACVCAADMDGVTDVAQTPWGKYLLEDLRSYVGLHLQALETCANQAERDGGMEKVVQLLKDTVFQLRRLAESVTWNDVMRHKEIDYGRLTFPKDAKDSDLAQQIKAVRDACKKGLEKRLRAFADPEEQVLAGLADLSGAVRGLVELTKTFTEQYQQLKRRRRVLDFGDLEHKTLDLLLGKRREGPTALAREIGSRFREIMVDEYQDSNAVQDAIFTALTQQKQNCFMVGDVKQSIYQFRLADPGIFLEKYNTYVPAQDAKPGDGRRILLSSNFRSGGGVISAVNAVFSACMSEQVGGLTYGEAEMLREGIPHRPIGEAETSLYVIPVQEDTYREEAVFVADRIARLLDGTHMVRDGDALRPIVPGDIVILLRSPGSVGGEFSYALQERGIGCVSGTGTDLLQTEEIASIRALLEIISNPLQDIPLVAALSSKIFAFTADDLAQLRGHHRYGSIYDALCGWKTEKAERFLKILEQLRMESRMSGISRLLETCYAVTGLDSIYAAMVDGARKQANLHAFCQIAADFETGLRGDLRQFLEYLDAMEAKGLPGTEEQSGSGSVTIMSIHKSKGLEFPVVFLCGLSREFNRESARAQVLCDQQLGLGLSCVDTRHRIRYPSVAKRAIAAKILSDSVSEELRVLYVAMTRAKDRLIMTYANKNPGKELLAVSQRMSVSARELLTADVDCPGLWVLLTALSRAEAGELFAIGGKPDKTHLDEPLWDIRVTEAVMPGETLPEAVETLPQMPPEAAARLRATLGKAYAYPQATVMPSKQTATQMKGRDKDVEAAQDAQPVRKNWQRWRRASFVEQVDAPAAMGTAVHAAMQHLRFAGCDDPAVVNKELRRMAEEGYLTPQQIAFVDSNQIAALFGTELGKRLVSCENLLREFKFSVLMPVETDGNHVESVLLQGVVDCAMIEPDGITVIDFKTDYVTEETLTATTREYTPQVQAYAQAMQRIYAGKLKAAYLYFFRLNRFVQIL